MITTLALYRQLTQCLTSTETIKAYQGRGIIPFRDHGFVPVRDYSARINYTSLRSRCQTFMSVRADDGRRVPVYDHITGRLVAHADVYLYNVAGRIPVRDHVASKTCTC